MPNPIIVGHIGLGVEAPPLDLRKAAEDIVDDKTDKIKRFFVKNGVDVGECQAPPPPGDQYVVRPVLVDDSIRWDWFLRSDLVRIEQHHMRSTSPSGAPPIFAV